MQIISSENGPRVRLMIALPNGHKFPQIIERLEAQLAQDFGGFTRLPMLGGWIAPESNKLETEAGCVYLVSVLPDDATIQRACYLFRQAGKDMGERWVHIEETATIAHHAQVNE